MRKCRKCGKSVLVLSSYVATETGYYHEKCYYGRSLDEKFPSSSMPGSREEERALLEVVAVEVKAMLPRVPKVELEERQLFAPEEDYEPEEWTGEW